MVVINSRCVDLLDELELRTVLGHEAGPHPVRPRALHHRAAHPGRALAGARLPFIAGLPLRAVDARAVRVVPRGRAVRRPRRDARQPRPARHLPHDDGARRRRAARASSTSTRSSARRSDYEEWSSGWDKINRMRNDLWLTHGRPVRRVKEIMEWVQSGEYDRIVGRRVPDARPAGRRAQGGRRGLRALQGALPPDLQRVRRRERRREGRRRAGEGRRRGREGRGLAQAAARRPRSSAAVAAAHAHEHAPRAGAHTHAPAPDADRRWLGVALGLILAFMARRGGRRPRRRLARAALRRRAHAHRRRLDRAGAVRRAARGPAGRRALHVRARARRDPLRAGQRRVAARARRRDRVGGDAAAERPAGRRGRDRARGRPRRRGGERRRGVGALARRAPLAQHRGRARARARRPVRVARRRAGRPARADRRLRARRQRRRAAGRRADGALGLQPPAARPPTCCSRPRRAASIPQAIGHALAAHPGVSEVHDLHVWEVTSGFPALSAHVLVPAGEDCHARRAELELLLAERFGSSTRRCRSSTRRPAGCSTSRRGASLGARGRATRRSRSSSGS